MPFAASLSTNPVASAALDEVCSVLAGRVSQPDLGVIFFTPHHAEDAERLAATVRTRLGPRVLIGCNGEGVLGNDREIERRPGLSVWLGKWNSPSMVSLEPFHLHLEQTSEGYSLLGWPDGLVGVETKTSAMLLLGDPFTFPSDYFLDRLNEDYQGLRVIGGMASGAHGRGQTRLLMDDRVQDAGAVGVLLQGAIGLRCIVSQGCRPIGQHLEVTKSQENMILELAGRPPLEVLQEMWQTMNPRDQELLQQGLQLGRVINEFLGEFEPGDFLIRNVSGLDRRTGAMEVGDHVLPGQTVQFHLRDGETADRELHALLQRDAGVHSRPAAGALVFSCNGRGERLFGSPDHDARTIRSEAGPIPLAGFFAAGELGPIGGQNFIHGFTASVALFEE